MTWNRQNKEAAVKLIQGAKNLKISYEFRNIRFIFSTIERIPVPKFSYYMEGLDQNWSSWTEQSEINYTRLPYGNYSFMVRTKSGKGIESEIISFPFEIQPPWFVSRLAMIIYIFIILILGLIFRILFIIRLKKQALKMASEEKEKRKQEILEVERRYMKLKNEKLQSEIKYQNNQLTSRAMAIVQKNELLLKIKSELEKIISSVPDNHRQSNYKKVFELIEKNIHSEEDWHEFEIHFDQANQNFFKRLKTQYPDLTSNDLRLCAYLRMNLSSKEIAPLLNISLRGVEIKRYRLRKRLNLDTEENLIDFLITF
jgi:DNA-binding CsgD family transcriptional regulator